VEPQRSALQFAAMDAIVDFARAQGMSVRGHTLLWHRSVPDWARETLASARDWRPVARYMGSVMPRYGEAIEVWDVVNEPLDPQGPGGLRADVFQQAFGDSYVARALETARLFAPHALLAINDYGLEAGDAEGQARRAALLRLLDRLHAAGAPLDGVGLQAHLDLARPLAPQARLHAFLRELAARGLAIWITELDVKEFDYAASPERRDAAVAAAAKALLDVALAEPRVVGVTTWGLSDRYSWLEVTKADLARNPHGWRDGSSPGVNRGLPLDAALRPKRMRAALIEAFRNARSETAAGSIK
jgi:endo-1,4-beta-xylanase